MPTSPKNFVWYELMTSDMDAAEAFYKAVIGWTSQAFDNPGMRYTIMSAGDSMVTGVMTLPEEARAMGGQPCWVGYIYADDVDATTESVKQAGGKVYKAPEDIPNIGRFSVVTDPQGAMFLLFKPSEGANNPPAPMGTPGHVGWHELYTTDWSKAFEFYSQQFGWTKDQAMDMGPMGTYQLFAAGDGAIGGMMNKPEGVPVPVWGYYFNVPAIDAAVTRVKENGGQVLNGPMEVPGGAWIVNCMDPQHAMFSLVAPSR